MNASKKKIDNSETFWQGETTITQSGYSAPVSSGFFMPVIRADNLLIWWVKRAEYKTRKGNKPRRLCAIVETRRLINAAQLLNTRRHTMNKQEKSVQTIVPIFPNDYKVIKKTKEDGTIIFEHPVGEEVETYTNSLDMMMEIIVNRFEALGKLTVDDDYDRIGFLIEALVEGARREIYEVFHFLDMSIGEINCTIVQRNQTIYRHGRILAVELKGKEQER